MMAAFDIGLVLCAVLCISMATKVLGTTAEEVTYLPSCHKPLGMQSGEIPDTSISASSSFDAKSVGPHNARIRTETNGGAWCPKPQVAEGVTEWLEIDLGELKVVTAVETQGRFGNGQGMEYATHFRLQYQRTDGGKWLDYRNKRNEPLFSGNKNTHIVVHSDVKPPIIARRVRFIPHSRYRRTVCMRVEVYGCPWTDGIVSYDMPQGDSRGSEVDLYDITYDGNIQDGFLSGGLGQLIDWDEGIDNFRLDIDSIGKKGYEWVGWKNDTVARQPVVITFEFDHVRNFTMVLLHCNNLFSKGVSVFRMVRVYFSIGGRYYNSEPVEYEYMVDVVMQMARWVRIPIPNHIGRFIKLELYFENRWILLSEVRINSTIVTDNVTEESAPNIPPSSVPVGGRDGKPTYVPNDGLYNAMPADDAASIGHKTQRNGSGHGDVKNETERVKRLDDTYVGIIIGALTALVLLCVIVFVLVFRRQRKKYKGSPHKLFGTNHMNFNLDDLTPAMANGKLSNGNMYNSIATVDEKEAMRDKMNAGDMNTGDIYREPIDGIQHRTLPVPPDDYSDKEYSTPPDLNKYSALVVNLPPNPIFHSTHPVRDSSPSPPPPTPPPPPHFRITDVTNIQGLMGNSIYALPSGDIWQGENMSVVEFPRENLQFIERIGEGQFGEVHLCEAVRVESFLGEDFVESGTRSLLVAVKTLRDDASQQARNDFYKEVKTMSRLKDANIVQVLGVCTRDEPLAVVVEYMKHGDLHQYLQHRTAAENNVGYGNSQKTVSYGGLIYIAGQIASGMKYLETLNVVHRDLATRNCLVGHHLTIKISDFGMSRSLYTQDYYRIEGRAILPIRWMAWESVLLGKFSTKSDVWSFAVTLWEILTFAREQPLEMMSDDEIIENCGHYYRRDNQEVFPVQPTNCPKEIYDLMCECWNREEQQRPTFCEIHMFLQRKNMGYSPREDMQMSAVPPF